MVQCEMCGAETGSPRTVKVEGAELQVCDSCANFGTEVKTQQSSSSSTKYSTSSSGGTSSGTSKSTGRKKRRRRDMFDQMEELASDYHQRIRSARESTGLSQEDLARDLNEKASLIRKLERGDMLPSDDVQKKLERKLDISLMEEADTDDAEWEGSTSPGTTTLGDVVKRKD